MADPLTISSTIASWFTPSSLFLFINLVIATIFLSSRLAAAKTTSDHHHDGDHHHPHLLRRSSSLLERFRSLHFYKNDAAFPETDHPHHHHLARTPSLVDRVRSFNFGFHNHVPEPAGPEATHVQPTEPGIVRTNSLADRVRSFKFGFHGHATEPAGPLKEHGQFTEPVQKNNQIHGPDDVVECAQQDGPELVRTLSLVDRVRSFYSHVHEPTGSETSFAKPGGAVQSKVEPEMVRTPSLLARLRSVMTRGGEVSEGESDEGNLMTSKSEEKKGTVEMLPERMKKSEKEKVGHRKRETEKVTRGGGSETTSFDEDEAVDARADDFINRFKQQLRLQRLNSFLRYKEMVAAT